MKKILVACLSTGNRIKSLEECVFKLKSLDVDLFYFELLILENTSEHSEDINSLVNRYHSPSFIINRSLENRTGIPFARNAALKYAIKHEFNFLAFIDDDAYPDSHWLNSLLMTQIRCNANVVTGPQIPIFSPSASNFFRFASIYSERKFMQDQKIFWAATNNVLMQLSFFKEQNLFFNENLTQGGEDKELFLRSTKAGAVICWDCNAVVSEIVVESRMTVSWAIDRSFRHGATGYAIESATKSKVSTIAVCIFKGTGYIFRSVLLFPVNFLFSKRSPLDSICDFFHGIGFFYGIFSKGKFKKYI
ncbi:glycosyltransferase family 2 protein [Shewanella sp.]|uniref:glycosyltransferase family 2 protein n=1 Tax=Shewanella sp. TaxID=50422 RepID=UPI0040474DAF